MNKYDEWLEEYKHLQGAHNQKKHGVRGGTKVSQDARVSDRQSKIDSAYREMQKSERVMNEAKAHVDKALNDVRQTDSPYNKKALKYMSGQFARARSAYILAQSKHAYENNKSEENRKRFVEASENHTKMIEGYKKQGALDAQGNEMPMRNTLSKVASPQKITSPRIASEKPTTVNLSNIETWKKSLSPKEARLYSEFEKDHLSNANNARRVNNTNDWIQKRKRITAPVTDVHSAKLFLKSAASRYDSEGDVMKFIKKQGILASFGNTAAQKKANVDAVRKFQEEYLANE